MQKNITLNDQNVSYTVRKSRKARRVRLSVYQDGSVVVTTPFRFGENVTEKFVREQTDWLLKKLNSFSQIKIAPVRRNSRADYLKHKESARTLVEATAQQLSQLHSVTYNRISIKNQKSCWGSCSKKNNLNFNYKIVFLPPAAQDYIVAHEVCHLKEFNHSKKFWSLVAVTSPDHTAIRRDLRKNGLSYY